MKKNLVFLLLLSICFASFLESRNRKLERRNQGVVKSVQKESFSKTSKEQIADILLGVKEHIDLKINQAMVLEHPFPHIVIEEIFPDHLYEQIKHKWPTSHEFVGAFPTRGLIPVTGGCIEETTLSTEQKIFWRIFGEIIVNRYIRPKLIEKLKYAFSMKLGSPCLGNELNKEDFINLRMDSLMQDSGDFYISPHVDQLNIFASILFYLPIDKDHEQFGTSFYSGPPDPDPHVIYQLGQVLKLEKTIPYKPNTIVCFLQSPISWHGVIPGQVESNYARRLYVSHIFLSPEFMEKFYQGIYRRSLVDEYFFDHRFLDWQNWVNIWEQTDAYE